MVVIESVGATRASGAAAERLPVIRKTPPSSAEGACYPRRASNGGGATAASSSAASERWRAAQKRVLVSASMAKIANEDLVVEMRGFPAQPVIELGGKLGNIVVQSRMPNKVRVVHCRRRRGDDERPPAVLDRRRACAPARRAC